jgi:uncharacterized protein YqgC (DUF456 family)
MDLETWLVPTCALAIVVGLVGIIVPVLPGLLLSYGAVVVWAVLADAGWGKWLVLGLATAWAVLGTVVKFAWPGRRMKRAGIPNLTLFAGVVGALIGFFLIPFVGLPLGFVGGIWVAEWQRHNDPKVAWPSTVEALKATGLSMLIELAAGALIAATWVAGVVFA